MKTFLPGEHPIQVIHHLLLTGIAPRPIALTGTMDAEGRHNLAPFSYYNAFGANPPVIAISPAIRATNGVAKHTWRNILATGEFTVNAVTHAMVEQASLASSDYEEGVDEFIKAGFTRMPSQCIRPAGVAESPFIMECRLMQHIPLGGQAGSGNLMIGEVLAFHVSESAFESGRLDQERLDLVGRAGASWYCRAGGPALFELAKPRHNGIGFDMLPGHLLHSTVLTGNDLAKLAGIQEIPGADGILRKWRKDLDGLNPHQHGPDSYEIELRMRNPRAALFCTLAAWKRGGLTGEDFRMRLHQCTQAFLREGLHDPAWECALMADPDIVAQLQ